MKVFTILKKIWYWSYERGSWQYDVMVFAILAFIFLIPARIFDDPEASPRRYDAFVESFVPADQTSNSSFEALSTALGGVEVHRVQAVRGPDGQIRGYRVWTRASRQ
jgi:hypothetical protein